MTSGLLPRRKHVEAKKSSEAVVETGITQMGATLVYTLSNSGTAEVCIPAVLRTT